MPLMKPGTAGREGINPRGEAVAQSLFKWADKHLLRPLRYPELDFRHVPCEQGGVGDCSPDSAFRAQATPSSVSRCVFSRVHSLSRNIRRYGPVWYLG